MLCHINQYCSLNCYVVDKPIFQRQNNAINMQDVQMCWGWVSRDKCTDVGCVIIYIYIYIYIYRERERERENE